MIETAAEESMTGASSLPTRNYTPAAAMIMETASDPSQIVRSADSGLAGMPVPVICEYCGAPHYHVGLRQGSHIFWVLEDLCDCPGAVAARERELAEREERQRAEEAARLRAKVRWIIGRSGMGARYLHRTFDNFQRTEHNRNALSVARRYAENFDSLMPNPSGPEPGRNGLFIAGPQGTGKTHLAAAISNYLIARGTPVICMTMIDLLARIKSTFSSGDVDEGSVLNGYKTVPLLVIDDMGKELPTEWAISTIYNIVNGRYEAELPTIVTTNYDTGSLVYRMTPKDTRDDTAAKATIDRLKEMCKGIELTGESWRSR